MHPHPTPNLIPSSPLVLNCCTGITSGNLEKNLPATQETEVRSLGGEDSPGAGNATTLVFLPGESQRQRSLVGCCLWGHTESDTTEVT